MNEQRHFLRVGTPILVEFPSPGTMKTERSFSSDVSETGMRFPTAVKFEIGQQVPMALALPFNGSTLHTTGEVMWIREIARHGVPQYEIGVRFVWVEDPDRQRLSRHLVGIVRQRV